MAAAAAAQLRASLLPNPSDPPRSPIRFPRLSSLLLPRSATLHPRFLAGSPSLPPSGPRGPRGTGGGGGGGGSSDSNDNDHQHGRKPSRSDPLSLFIEGWRSRVAADPQFPFKVLMEELVGVSANVIGDMASRPNFGLNELDFVFSTLVVGSIVNFVLMYLLAPTAAVAAAGAVSSSLPPFVFAPGQYSAGARVATLFTKGFAFAAVGFAAGLAGTAISNGLVALRKRMDPGFETNNKPPPTVLNALTWAAHMGVSANVRYQTVNGMEFLMDRVLPPVGFKATVVVLRCLNNLLGGMTFVMLARLTGSQKVEDEEEKGEKERLILVSREEEDGNGNGDGRRAADE